MNFFTKNIKRIYNNLRLAPKVYKFIKDNGRTQIKAAAPSRFYNGWSSSRQEIDATIRGGLVSVRSHARDLELNNGNVNKIIQDFIKYVIGSEAPKFQCLIRQNNGDLDDELNEAVEEKFREWCKADFCTLSKDLSFVRVCWGIIRQLVIAGEFIIRQEMKNPNKFGFTFELLEPDYIDETYNDVLPSGNVVRMGIEFNPLKQKVRYHLKKNLNHITSIPAYDLTPVEAFQIIHDFDRLRFTQSRALSSLTPIMVDVHKFDKMEDASLDKAIINSRTSGFISSTPEGFSQYSGGDLAKANKNLSDEEDNVDTVEEEEDEVFELESGVYVDLKDKRFIGFDPKFPFEMFNDFIKSVARRISSGVGLWYNILFNDLENVNFSSLRHGRTDSIETYKHFQTLMREGFLNVFTPNWFKQAVLSGEINFPFSKIETHFRYSWQFRGYEYIQPVDDINASVTAIENNLSTKTAEAAKVGKDFDAIIRERKRELKKEKELAVIESEIQKLKNPVVAKTGEAA